MSRRSSRRNLPSLNALRAFEAAARHLSFKEAALELNVSQSAVSHQVKGLEETLGFALFTRGTRSIALTRRGKLYYPILRNAFESISDGTDLILEKSAVQVITLQVYSTFTIRWLLPRLNGFQMQMPDLQVRLTTSQADANFGQDDVDAAIMIGYPSDPALRYDKLFDVEFFPVCSPTFLEKLSSDFQARDLRAEQILQVYPSADDWHDWLRAHQLGALNTDNGLQLDSYDVAFNSALQGIGIALGQQPYINQEMALGSLVEVFPGMRVRNKRSWYLACRQEKSEQPKIEALRLWLLAEIAKDDNLPLDQSPLAANSG
jgi:LysR family glycine cleavage system transcriptional activator